MVIEVDLLIAWLNKQKESELLDVEHYKASGDMNEVDARENRAVAYGRVIDHLTCKIK